MVRRAQDGAMQLNITYDLSVDIEVMGRTEEQENV
jgi:hypothetical protein